MKLKEKKAATFGSYGWSGEASKQIAEELKKAGFRIISDGIKVVWTPTEEMLEECKKFGEEFVKYCELNVK